MKTTNNFKALKSRTRKTMVLLLIVLVSLFGLSSCREHGYDGMPGMAYLALDWELSEPSYLDAGTTAIPPVFEWGTYYSSYPGIYNLYYEGRHWKGYYWAQYAWEIEYEVYENIGTPGGYGYNGADGMNSYFTIICSPYGPDYSHYDSYYRKTPGDDNLKTGETITLKKDAGKYSIKITYRKVEPRNHSNENDLLRLESLEKVSD